MKNINIKLGISLLLVAVLGFTSCEDNLDVNKDPNNPPLEQGSPVLVFPAALASTAGRIGGEYAIVGGMWSQYWTQSPIANQFRNIDSYNVNQLDFNGSFNETFAGALNDYHYIITKAAEEEDWNFYLMGTVMSAYTYQVMLDLYDMLPYDEAFQGIDNLQPQYEDGYTVYTKLLASIDDALSKDFGASIDPGQAKSDLVFEGEMNQWAQFANTLKLKMYLRMIDAKPGEAEAGIKALYANDAEFLTADAFLDVFVDQPDKSNPLFEFNYRQLNINTNLRASNTLGTFLQSNGDPRLGDYYTKPGGAFTGMDQGDYANNIYNDRDVANAVSVAIVNATDPVDFISLAESYFLQAEALERYFSGSGAKEMYDMGVAAALDRYGHAAQAADFTGAGGAYEYPASGSFEEKLEAIIVQKWISFHGSHSLEAFFERNRTGYPRTSTIPSSDPAYIPGQFVTPVESVLNDNVFPKRLIFPDTETKRNPNTPAIVPLTEGVWWDTK